MIDQQNVLTEKQAAQYLGLSVSFLRADRAYGPRAGHEPGPPWIQLGRRVGYMRSDLDEWLAARRRRHETEAVSKGKSSRGW